MILLNSQTNRSMITDRQSHNLSTQYNRTKKTLIDWFQCQKLYIHWVGGIFDHCVGGIFDIFGLLIILWMNTDIKKKSDFL
eukprot:UN08390